MVTTPQPLREWLQERVDALRAAACAANVAWPEDAEFARTLDATLLASDYSFEQFRRRPALLPETIVGSVTVLGAQASHTASLLEGAPGELGVRLRRYRHAHCLRLIARDVAGIVSSEQTLTDTSRLADVCLETALSGVEIALTERRQPPRDRDGHALRLCIIGMGKLGGNELNFSSDVDLIFGYADPAPAGADDAESMMARAGQRVVNLLSGIEADGFVHRVDMRLRPFGSVGRLALPQSAMEQYYQREGRDWERYAWVKARAVAGDRALGVRLIAALRPFVFRRYLDYAAIDALREMKTLIDAEVARADRRDDLKLGPGGIREIEFLVQLTQLTRAGREPALAVPGLLAALAAARATGAIPVALADMLGDAYRVLRQVENRVQMLRDEQTHRLPDDTFLRARIAHGLGFEHADALDAKLAEVRGRVADAFADTLLPARRVRSEPGSSQHGPRPIDTLLDHSRILWMRACEAEVDAAAKAALGLDSGHLEAILALAGNVTLRALPERHALRRDRLLPALIAESVLRAHGLTALPRLLALIRAIAGRPSYIALLDERPHARERVVDVFERSGFLAAQVIAHPLLLDDLLDERQDTRERDVDVDSSHALRAALDARLADAGEDPEEMLGVLHEFKLARQFRIGLAWLARRHSADETSGQLAALAQALAAAAHARGLADTSAQYGAPAGSGRDGLLMLGYGSLGAGELGFASDLDLVFVYDAAMAAAATEGIRPLEGARWFARRVQRTVHWLTTPTRAGELYAVDVRLRPDGGKGLLVSSFDGFADYQRTRAWTWELQALVRARPIAGDDALCATFAALRRERLCVVRDAATVRQEVLAMRMRWRRELDRSDAQYLDLKQGEGGLVDLEFLLQSLVLTHAAHHPALTEATRTRDLLGQVAQAGLLDTDTASALAAAHETLLAASLDCTLDLRPRRVPRTPDVAAAANTIRDACRAHGLLAPD